MKLCTAAQIREFDRQTIRQGTAGVTLMQRAGQHVCDACEQLLVTVNNKDIIIACGGGNNGGDGFVAARLLSGLGATVHVLLLVSPEKITGDAKVNFDLLTDISVIEINDENKASTINLQGDLVVDGLLGTGLARDVAGRFACLIQRINESGVPVLSVDIPSGLDADSGQVLGCAVQADVTVTFQLQKQGMVQYPARDYVGSVIVCDIGILPQLMDDASLAQLLSFTSIRGLLPKRISTGHKGSFGHILVVAGSSGKTGAAILSGLGCLRSGAGLVSLCVPERLNQTLEMNLIEAMTIPVQGQDGECFHNRDYSQVMAASKGKSCIVVGPGLGMEDSTIQFVNQLVQACDLPLVIDADGLNALDLGVLQEKDAKKVVLTPHPGEMARLTGLSIAEIQRDRVAAAKGLAQKLGVVVVLKGAATVVASPDGEIAVNSTGNSGMGVGGMGDVLSGIIGALLGQGLSVFAAACCGVFCHGRAGDLLVQSGMPFGYLASELADALPDVWQEFKLNDLAF